MSMPESTPQIDAFPNRRRILVLGASGFIGARVVQALAAGDWATPIAARHRAGIDPALSVETRQLDATQRDALDAALRGVDGVVNCIAGDNRAIVASARALFDASSRLAAPPRIVHLSSMMVYGTTTGLVDETAELKGDWDGYSAAKSEVEKLARDCPRVVQLRPGIVYGPASPIWIGRIGRWLSQRRLGDLGASGRGYCNLVHVDDVVEAVLRCLRLPGIEGEVFNLSLTSPPTWNEFFRLFAQALGVPIVRISHFQLMVEQFLLAPPLKVAERLASAVPLRWHSPDAIRPWLPRLCAHPLRLDVRKAEEMLQMQWIPLDRGLRESAAWFRALESVRTRS